jgi:hypothetical protein
VVLLGLDAELTHAATASTRYASHTPLLDMTGVGTSKLLRWDTYTWQQSMSSRRSAVEQYDVHYVCVNTMQP